MAPRLKHYRKKIDGAVSLPQAMQAGGCQMLVFPSRATTYVDSACAPITEDFPRSHTNPYDW